MTGNYKYGIQELADELAREMYHRDFYDLSFDKQDTIYWKAAVLYVERQMEAAKQLKEKLEQGGK